MMMIMMMFQTGICEHLELGERHVKSHQSIWMPMLRSKIFVPEMPVNLIVKLKGQRNHILVTGQQTSANRKMS